MSNVFVVDTKYRPLDPVHPGYARHLLGQGKAAVYRSYPFTIILKKELQEPVTHPLRLKIDPGSKTTGLAIVNDVSEQVVWAAHLSHRGQAIKKALAARRAVRRGRRQRKTRYRKPRFDNRRRKAGWLPPSLESCIATIETWVHRLRRYCPIGAISQELVKFDMQAINHPGIEGVQYQQGELQGYEVREYLLEKWNRQCAYCGAREVPLQIEHILCRAHGGTNSVSNLCLACEPCNTKKGTQDIRDFLEGNPNSLKRILAQTKAPLKEASAVNATRWALYERLKATGLSVECGTGGRTKYNRVRQGLGKEHWIDAACVGASTPVLTHVDQIVPLLIKATGHGCRQMCVPDKYGFPRQHKAHQKSYMGYQTGDMVKAIIPTGKYAGTHKGRIAIRFRPSFRLNGVDVHPKYMTMVQRSDGYSYTKGVSHASLGLRVPAAMFMAKQASAKNEKAISNAAPIKVITVNRQAYHDYIVERTLEVGIALLGTEIKSIRNGKVNLRGSYAMVRNDEIWLENAHIAVYEHGNRYNHEPLRNRKLLLHRREIHQLQAKVATKGLTLVPLKLYLKGGKAKIELGLCRGKKLFDKRDAIAERDVKREMERAIRTR